MGIEIERKFLVTDDAWRTQATDCETMRQGYLAGPPAARCSVRVRIVGERASLNIKSASSGIVRDEYEYAIALLDAQRMLATLAGNMVEKRRHYVDVAGHVFEVDEFGGDNTGLVVAEIELDHVGATFTKPAWLGRDVSSLSRYYNLELATYPYSRWSEAERNPDAAT